MAGYYDTVGGGVFTPSLVLAEMRTVDSAINSLGIDIQAYADRLPAGFMRDWIAFRVEWKTFFEGNDGWISRATNTVYDKVQEYRARVMGWRDQFVRAGGTPSVPALPVSSKISVGAIVAGVGIVSLVAWYLFKVDHS